MVQAQRGVECRLLRPSLSTKNYEKLLKRRQSNLYECKNRNLLETVRLPIRDSTTRAYMSKANKWIGEHPADRDLKEYIEYLHKKEERAPLHSRIDFRRLLEAQNQHRAQIQSQALHSRKLSGNLEKSPVSQQIGYVVEANDPVCTTRRVTFTQLPIEQEVRIKRERSQQQPVAQRQDRPKYIKVARSGALRVQQEAKRPNTQLMSSARKLKNYLTRILQSTECSIRQRRIEQQEFTKRLEQEFGRKKAENEESEPEKQQKTETKKEDQKASQRRESLVGSRPRVTVLMKEERSKKRAGEVEGKPLISKRSSADLSRKRAHPKLMQHRVASQPMTLFKNSRVLQGFNFSITRSPSSSSSSQLRDTYINKFVLN